VIGFISSVTGIASWLGITSIHLGNAVVPNPIIVVVATLLAMLLIAVAFCFGAYYILAVLSKVLSALFVHAMEALAKGVHISLQAPSAAETSEKEQAQIIQKE
jgi:hypothetical protein